MRFAGGVHAAWRPLHIINDRVYAGSAVGLVGSASVRPVKKMLLGLIAMFQSTKRVNGEILLGKGG